MLGRDSRSKESQDQESDCGSLEQLQTSSGALPCSFFFVFDRRLYNNFKRKMNRAVFTLNFLELFVGGSAKCKK